MALCDWIAIAWPERAGLRWYYRFLPFSFNVRMLCCLTDSFQVAFFSPLSTLERPHLYCYPRVFSLRDMLSHKIWNHSTDLNSRLLHGPNYLTSTRPLWRREERDRNRRERGKEVRISARSTCSNRNRSKLQKSFNPTASLSWPEGGARFRGRVLTIAPPGLLLHSDVRGIIPEYKLMVPLWILGLAFHIGCIMNFNTSGISLHITVLHLIMVQVFMSRLWRN